MKLTLGFSPCPNDTFIFDAMVNGKIETKGLEFSYVMEDVETLNHWAREGRLDITKLSYNTFLQATHNYALLHSGSALGTGVGPLLVAREPIAPEDIPAGRIAIPGKNTTANLLLTLAFPKATDKHEIKFSEIEQAVVSGDYDIGLIIHESRFTYEQKGLVKLLDLGDWWEQETGAAIPLGGIVARRNFDKELCSAIDGIIRESVLHAWKQYPALPPFVKNNAQEMQEDVMRQHIELYVNDYTTDLGERGVYAIETLFANAKNAGILHGIDTHPQIFY